MTNQNKSQSTNDEIVSYVHIFINVFTVVFIAFTVHRFFNFKSLSEAVPSDSPANAFLVGSLSDIWIGFILTAVVSIIFFGAKRLGKTPSFLVQFFFFLIFTGTLSAHQGYVGFFKFQLEPFHLSYLSDAQFIGSNAASFLTSSNAIMTLLVGITAALMYVRKGHKTQTGKSWVTIAIFAALALIAHNRNIHYRVQWFVPENLQTNVLESFYLRSKKLGNTVKLLPGDFVTAGGVYNNGLLSETKDRYQSTVFSAALKKQPILHPTAPILKQAFKNQIDSGTNPTVIVVLLESLRPSETGAFSPNLESLTPHLDALATSGIWFRRAFSTGSVTRSGQEAAFCGNFSGRNTSLMRNFDALPYRCITDVLNDETAAKFWYHGGDGRFDGQEAFWQRHNIKDLMTAKSFPEEAERTGWGVGDDIFFKEAARKIQTLKQLPTSFSLGMLLSVTNHIPWHLPGSEHSSSNSAEPWFLTTSYTDKSIGTLVEGLKKSTTWDSTLLFILSDHGNKTKPYADLYKVSKNTSQLLQSHINLIISGGITEGALKEQGIKTLSFDHFVSQADISTTLVDILGLAPLPTMGKNLFDQASHYPILSQTEEGIYIPALDQLISYPDLSKKLPPEDSPDWIYRFHYKASLEYLLEMRSKR